MSAIYYGKQKDFNWRLGDTSTRYKNQIAFNEFLLEQCFHHDEGLNDDEVYQLMYQNGYKRKSQASKPSDSSLAINTLKSLELVIYDSKTKKYFITPKGQEFYQLLNNQSLDPYSQLLFKVMHVQLKDLLWLTYLFQIVVNQKGQKEYAPFVYLIKQLIQNDLEEKDFLTKWTLFRQEPTTFKLNDATINLIKNHGQINLSKSNNAKEFFEHFKNKTLNEDMLSKLLSSNGDAFKENLKLILDGDVTLHQKYLAKVARIVPAHLLNKPEFIQAASVYLNKFSYEDLCTIYQNNKHYITAEKEYANINKYWLNGIKVFLFELGMLKIRPINKAIFSYIFQQIGVKKYEHLDFKQTSSYFLNQVKVKEIIEMLIHQGFDLKVEEKEAAVVLPYSRDDVEKFLEKINDYLTDETLFYDFKKQEQLESISKPTIVVDKWLTGFDVPDLDTMYLDKIIKWHNLMQAIARVNRTYENPQYQEVKENGLIVDYIGIWRKLRDALLQYTKREDDPNDFSIEDVENAHDSLVQQLKIIEENYIPDLFASYQPDLKNNAQIAYRFIMNAWEQISNLAIEDCNRFLMMANSVKKFTKVAYSVLSDDEIWASRVVGEVYALQNSSTRFDDARLYATIEQMKVLTKQAILVNDKQIIVEEAQINRDLSEVATLMQQEANELAPTNPKIAVKIITMAIKTIIDKVSTMRPIFAEKASERLQTIVLEFDKTIDAANLLEELNRLFKDLRQDYDQWSQEPPELQAFMEIIGNDEYFQEAKNSPIVEEIATKLVNLIKQQGIVQYDTNPRVRTLILREIKKLLRTDYNYPPERLGGTSKILIDSIDKQIKLNPHYFEESI